MKRKNFVLLALILLSCLFPVLGAQQTRLADQSTTQKGAPKDQAKPAREEDVVRISVTLVQVDAVVTDKQGNPVTDLGSSDFEIYEDGRKQHIANFSFVAAQPESTPAPAKSEPRGKTPLPPGPPTRLRPDQVRRTIALVVDDLGLSFESTAAVRDALRRFVDQQMVLDYALLIYNAQRDPKTNQTQLESQVILLKDGKPVFDSKVSPLNVGEKPDWKHIPASGRLRLGDDLTSGDYILQIIITDNLAKEKYRRATQWMDFEMLK